MGSTTRREYRVCSGRGLELRRPWLLAAIALLAGCPTEGEPPEVLVEVDGASAVAEVDPRFLSFAVDTAQVLGGRFWNPDSEDASEPEVWVDPYDFERERLRMLAAELAPGILRVGGTAADTVYYDLSEDPVDEPPEGYELLLTRDEWEGFAGFAGDLGLDLFFTLNVGPGPRDEGGDWVPDNSRELMEYAVQRGDPVVLWELGNEINAFLLAHGSVLSVDDYAADLATARALVDEVAPDALLAGPSSAYWPAIGDMTGFYPAFMPVGGHLLDAVTWHYYPMQSHRCPVASRPAGPEVMLDPVHLDEVHVWSDEIEGLAAQYAPGASVWLGESGNAQCGGEPDVSDTWAGSFWWLDQLGALAARGQPVVVRQTLSGSDYGLVDDVTLEPNPDYWVSVLHKRLMGPSVLSASTQDTDRLRTYAHCDAGGGAGAVAVALINLSDQSMDVGIDLPGPALVYELTAFNLFSKTVYLNDETLEAGGAVPDLVSYGDEREDARIVMDGRSLAFVRMPDAAVDACD